MENIETMNNIATASGRELVIRFINEMNVSPVDQEDITEDLELQRDLKIDSLNKLILLTRITEHLGFDFSKVNGTVADFRTVGDLVSLVEEFM